MHKIYIKNTLSRKKEEFKPINDGEVLFYHCGPTVYWDQHIGNLRGMFCADIIVRIFKYIGYNVKYVRNYTDVGHLTSDGDTGEDKMQKGAIREKKTPLEIANKYIERFESDTKKMNIVEPFAKPRATECIQEIIDLVAVLLKKGFAYNTGLAIYFDVSKFDDYTKLSGQNLDDLFSGAGAGEVRDNGKKNPFDFALWFFKAGVHKNALQYWSSPFNSNLVENGEGFPGWHIECSAMSKKYLGDTIDIHMGGIEHIPIHHTNEIAQSESANGVKFANYWLHNEFLVFNDQKISKSGGSKLTLATLEDKGFNALSLRFLFLQAQYRSKQNFTWESLESAANGLEHLRNQVSNLGTKIGKINNEYKDMFIDYLSDDFNVPGAFSVVVKLLKSEIDDSDKLATIIDFDRVLGLDLKSNKYIIKLSNFEIESDFEINEDLIDLIKERQNAKLNKDWNKSDEIRDEIKERFDCTLEDSKDLIKIKKI